MPGVVDVEGAKGGEEFFFVAEGAHGLCQHVEEAGEGEGLGSGCWEEGYEGLRGGVEAELVEDGGEVGLCDGVVGGGIEDFKGLAHGAEQGWGDVSVVACVGEGGKRGLGRGCFVGLRLRQWSDSGKGATRVRPGERWRGLKRL